MIEKNVCFTSDKSILQALCHSVYHWNVVLLHVKQLFVSVSCTLYCIEQKCPWRSLRPHLFFRSFVPEWLSNVYLKLETLFGGFILGFRLKG